MLERFSEKSKCVLVASKRIASQTGSREIDPEHILLALLSTDQKLAVRFLGSPWATEDIWRELAHGRTNEVRIPGASDLPIGSASKSVITFAREEADMMRSGQVCTEHLFLALLRDRNGLTSELLNRHAVEYTTVREQLLNEPHQDAKTEVFVKRDPQPEEIVQLLSRIESISMEIRDSIANRDFARATALSTEERQFREKLTQFYLEHGSLDWLYD